MPYILHYKNQIYEINHRICYMIYQDGLNSSVLYLLCSLYSMKYVNEIFEFL